MNKLILPSGHSLQSRLRERPSVAGTEQQPLQANAIGLAVFAIAACALLAEPYHLYSRSARATAEGTRT